MTTFDQANQALKSHRPRTFCFNMFRRECFAWDRAPWRGSSKFKKNFEQLQPPKLITVVLRKPWNSFKKNNTWLVPKKKHPYPHLCHLTCFKKTNTLHLLFLLLGALPLRLALSAGVEMRGIAYAEGSLAAEILLALAENNCEAEGGRCDGCDIFLKCSFCFIVIIIIIVILIIFFFVPVFLVSKNVVVTCLILA